MGQESSLSQKLLRPQQRCRRFQWESRFLQQSSQESRFREHNPPSCGIFPSWSHFSVIYDPRSCRGRSGVTPFYSNYIQNELKGFLTWIRSIHESCLIKLEEIKVIPDAEASFNVIIRQLSGNKSQASGFVPTTKEYQNDAIENLNKLVFIQHALIRI